MPPDLITGSFVFLYIITYLVELIIAYLKIPADSLLLPCMRAGILFLFSIYYGAYRVWHFHPFYNKRYSKWLATSPWNIKKPLLLGPIHLTLTDLLAIVILMFLVYSNNLPNKLPFILPVIFFLLSYMLFLLFTFEKEQAVYVFLFFFLLPFTIYPIRHLVVAVGILVLIYVILYLGLRNQLRSFPWNSSYWQLEPKEAIKKQDLRTKVILWPYSTLRAYEPLTGIKVSTALLISALVTWFFHALCKNSYNIVGASFLLPFVFYASFIRWCIYLRPDYSPPISFLGRIWNKRFIIPGYDKIFIAPVCLIIVSIVIFITFFKSGLRSIWAFDVSLFLMLLLAFTLPPKLKDWRLTGHYSAKKPGPSRCMFLQKPADPIAQYINEAINWKFGKKILKQK
jgi:hypothetical protein